MNARLKPLLILAGSLCVCLLTLVAYACILQFHGWYHGAPEEGIARYAGVRQEDVRICVTQQEEGYLYAIWENAATGECAGPQLSPSHGCNAPQRQRHCIQDLSNR